MSTPAIPENYSTDELWRDHDLLEAAVEGDDDALNWAGCTVEEARAGYAAASAELLRRGEIVETLHPVTPEGTPS